MRRRVHWMASWAILVTGAFIAPLPAFVESPGSAMAIGERIGVTVEGRENTSELLLLTIRRRRATPVSFTRALMDPRHNLRDDRRVTRDETDGEYFARQRSVFVSSGHTASAVGLDMAGLHIDFSDLQGDGVQVLGVRADAPAAGVLRAGDIILAIDSAPTGTVEALRNAVAREPGILHAVTIYRAGREVIVEVASGSFETSSGIAIGLGIDVETVDPRVALPVDVILRHNRIGGPSAGLVLTLAVYDAATPEDLTAGLRVAATGTVNADGEVGRVGGVPHKTITAHRAGADLLLVPAAQERQAKESLGAGSRLRVVGVETVDDAVQAILDAASTVDGGRPGASLGKPATGALAAEEPAGSGEFASSP